MSRKQRPSKIHSRAETKITGSLRNFLLGLSRYRAANHPADRRAPSSSAEDSRRLASFLTTLRATTSAARRRGDFIDVWDVAQLRRDEARNASVLAWLLNPGATHGRGGEMLNSLLSVLKTEYKDRFPLSLPIAPRYSVATEVCPFAEQTNRVDIVIDGDGFFIFLEIKIDAAEGPQQISRYLETARRKAATGNIASYAVIYLSRFPLENEIPLDPHLIGMTWKQASQAIAAVLPKRDDAAPFLTDILLRQFARHIATL